MKIQKLLTVFLSAFIFIISIDGSGRVPGKCMEDTKRGLFYTEGG